MKKKLLVITAIIAASPLLYSFCGFYVSKADGTLKNKTSQVILVRDDNRTVITMFNDFKGDAKDFALVVPVPVVLQKNDIKVVSSNIFQTLNDYSAPRLVEYYDENPCEMRVMEDKVYSMAPMGMAKKSESEVSKNKSLGVTIEANYTVGEYDILILSAKESSGLKTWLNDNGYKIPKGAEEVLDPYIKSNLKFFVVKVNLKEKEKSGVENLRPLQIKFSSPKFMLPIRLGMANSDGDQDMIVYAFTRTGRIETTNYRTVSVPTGENIPLFVQKNFSAFYGNIFQHQWKKEDKSIAFLEYAWDVSPANYVKCDPCVSNPPNYNDLKQAGVWWLGKNNYDDYVNEYEKDKSKVYFTRLHVRYNRSAFPQDLSFQVTPNSQNFQARYIITHPATGTFNCEAGKKYLRDLKSRRMKEMEMLSYLTGKDVSEWNIALNDEESTNLTVDATYGAIAMNLENAPRNKTPVEGIVIASAMLLGCVTIVKLSARTK